mgnify:FL=1
MKKNILITLLAALLLSSCGEYNKLLKSTDYEYKYEAAKNYFAKGQYNRAATLLNELIAILKGTDKAEESLYMLGMSYYNQKDYQTAAQTFIQYYNVYPRGTFTDWHVFMPVKLYIWILRSRVWTNPVRIAPSSSCRCLWNTSRKAPRKKKRRT